MSNKRPRLKLVVGAAEPSRTIGAPLVRDTRNRGYLVSYRPGELNWCPACGRSHWLIGRLSAECAFCATALPLTDIRLTPCGRASFTGVNHAGAEVAA
jgi:hypothetical protein